MTSEQRRVGVVGYGKLGEFLVTKVLEDSSLELAFVWNRSMEAFTGKVDAQYILDDLSKVSERSPDIIIEVAHPCISKDYGKLFLETADYLVGSPTALADAEVEATLRAAATKHSLYLPAGAFWGGEDIKKMADRGTLQALRVSMTKHPSSLKLQGELKVKNEGVTDTAVTLYEGPVRGLCPLAPNNVNTMAVASMAAGNLGFDKVIGRLVADPAMTDWHIVEVDAWGPGDMSSDRAFHVHTERRNPADPGAVTGTATYMSFFSSLKCAVGRGPEQFNDGMATSFGWKNKRVKLSTSQSTSSAFSEEVQVDPGNVDEDVDWLHNVPIKKRKEQLEDAVSKAKRLNAEGITLAEAERYWEAIGKWNESLTLFPNDEKTLEMKAQALSTLNELYPAVNVAEQAVNAKPTWWVSQQTLGRCQLNIGEIKSAIVAFQKAIHLQPDCEELWVEDLQWARDLLKDLQTKHKHLTQEELSFHVRECIRIGINQANAS